MLGIWKYHDINCRGFKIIEVREWTWVRGEIKRVVESELGVFWEKKYEICIWLDN